MTLDRPVTLPEPFWAAMPADDQQEVHRLTEAGVLLLPSGSRYICPGKHRDDSDFDLYAVVDPQFAASLAQDAGWYTPDIGAWQDAAEVTQKFSRADDSMQFLRGELNLILFFHIQRFAKFKDATDLCRSICVTKRDDRVKIFRAICDEQIPQRTTTAKAVANKTSATDSTEQFSVHAVAF